MSGPKVVDVKVIRAGQDRAWRKLRYAIDRQMQRLLRKLEQHADASIRQQLDAIRQALIELDARHQSTDASTLIDNLLDPARAYHATVAELKDKLEQRRIDSLAESLAREHSLSVAIAAMLPRLQTAGLPSVVAALQADPTEAQLQNAIDRLAQSAKEQSDEAQQKLVDSIAGGPVTLSVSEWLAAQPPAQTAAQLRLEQLAARIAVLEELDDASPWLAHVTEIQKISDPQRQRLKTDSLLIQLAQEITRCEELARRTDVLDDLDAELAAFDSAADRLRREVAEYRESPLRDVSVLQQKVQTWCVAQATRVDQQHSRQAILSVLQSLGYEVHETMATAWAEAGKVVVHTPGSEEYGVELSTVAGDRLKTQLVRFGDPSGSNSMQQQRDVEMETSWCQSHAEVLNQLGQRGLQIKLLTARPIGSTPVAVIQRPREGQTNAPASVEKRNLRQLP